MARRALPVGLAAAAVALDELGRLLDGGRDYVHALLWTIVLALTVVGAAARAPDLSRGLVPGIARTTLLACLAIFCVQAVLGLAAELRRR